jgi:hypothetical protein
MSHAEVMPRRRASIVTRTTLFAGVVLAACLTAHSARADEPVASPDRLRAAEEEYDAGRRAFLADQFEVAASHFENAFRDAPRAQVLRNAMRSRQKAKQIARAATLADLARRRYAADQQTRELADEILADAASKLDELRITCSPECSVAADGKIASLDDARQFSVYLEPGLHSLVFAFSQGRTLSRSVDSKAGGREDVSVEAPAVPKASPPAPVLGDGLGTAPGPGVLPATPKKHDGLPPAVFFVGVGLTVAAGAATVISGVAAINSPGKDAVRTGCVGQGTNCALYQSGLAAETRTNVGIGVTAGLALLTTIGGVFLTDWGGSSTTGSASRKIPNVGVGWQSVSVQGSF